MKHRYLLIIAAFTIILQQVSGQEWLTGWDHRIKIEIDHILINENLSAFPVAVKLDVNNFIFTQAEADGSDIRFTEADGETLMIFEREIHDAIGEKAVYWVRLPQVSADANTVFYVYFGNSSAADLADISGEVWDNNFRAVWHMDHFEDWNFWFIEDRKLANDGEKISENIPQQIDGLLGQAQNFEGEDYISIYQHPSLRISGSLTLSAWVKIGELTESSEATIFGQSRSTYRLEAHENLGGIVFKGYINNNEITAHAEKNEYIHVGMNYNGSSFRLFINGELTVNESLSGAIPATGVFPFFIGSEFVGGIDEVRVSATARSNAWIKADYHSGYGDLLKYDLSGFEVLDPGQQTAGIPFNISIVNARTGDGSNLNGNFLVTVTSSVQSEGENENGILFSDEAEFISGDLVISDIMLLKADMHSVTISIEGITSDESINISVTAAAASKIVFITAPQTIPAGGTSSIITIQLQDEFGNEVASGVDGTTVNLSSDLNGTFLDVTDDQVTISDIFIANEESEASFRFTATMAGIHELKAGSSADLLTEGIQDLTVSAGSPVKIVFVTEEQIVEVGAASDPIGVQLQDQYDNEALSDGPVTILLTSSLGGNFWDIGNSQTITYIEIGDQESGASFRYIPGIEGSHVLSAVDQAETLTSDTQDLHAIGVYVFTGFMEYWEDPESWLGGEVPPEDSRVIIESGSLAYLDAVTVLYIEVHGQLQLSTGQSLSVKNGGRLTVEPDGIILSGGNITINGQIVIKPGGRVASSGTITNNTGTNGLVIESGQFSTGSLHIGNSGVPATVQRWATGNEWHVVSVPVSGMTIGEFLTGNNEENDIFFNSSQNVHAMTHYNETINPNGGWAAYYGPADHSLHLESGRSYLIRKRADGILTFRGELVTNVTGLEIHRVSSGWHSLGNPFPSALRARGTGTSAFLGHNASSLDPAYAALYIYNPANPNLYSIISNNAAQILESGERPVIDQVSIQSGQGFLVRARDGSSTVNFTQGMRTHITGAAFYKKSTEEEEYWPTLILNVNYNNKKATTTVTFNEEMTKGLDVTYDAGMLGGDPDFKIYTRLVEEDSGINFAIQCLPDYSTENMIIPVGFDFSAGGEVRFSTDILALPAGATALLEDRHFEVFTDLSDDDYIVSLLNDTNGVGRFFVHVDFQVTSVEDKLIGSEEILDIYSYGKEIFIKGPVGNNAQAVVYNIMGRMIKTVKLQPSEINSIKMDDQSRGIFLIQISGGKINQTERLFVE